MLRRRRSDRSDFWTTANLLPTEVAAHECIEHFTLRISHTVQPSRVGRAPVSGATFRPPVPAVPSAPWTVRITEDAWRDTTRRPDDPTREPAGPAGTGGTLDADNYQAEHGAFLGDVDFVWCPEGLREADAGLLGAVAGRAGAGGRLRRRGRRPLARDPGRRGGRGRPVRRACCGTRGGRGERTGVRRAAGAGRRDWPCRSRDGASTSRAPPSARCRSSTTRRRSCARCSGCCARAAAGCSR